MAYPRTLTDEQIFAARWEWEHTPITKVQIGTKWGLSPPAVHKWATKQGWQKAEELRTYDGQDGAEQFKRDLAAAVQAAFNRQIIKGLIDSLAKGVVSDRTAKVKSVVAAAKPPGPKPKAAKVIQVEAADQPPPPPPPSSPDPGVGPLPGKRKRGRPRKNAVQEAPPGQVIAFPGNFVPPAPKVNATALPPPPSRSEQVAIRTQLSHLRGELTVQQLEAIDRHDQILDEYQHLISVFLNPSRYVDTAGLSEEARIEKLREMSAAAGRALLPTERDTLANAVTALSRARLQSILTKRQVAGLVGKKLAGGPTADPDAEEDGASKAEAADLARMEVGQLRKVRDAMELLTGHAQRSREPPKPPPPDPLDDLVPER